MNSPTATERPAMAPSLAHQCHVCRRYWALRVVDHPAGTVVLCRYCSAVRASIPGASLQSVSTH